MRRVRAGLGVIAALLVAAPAAAPQDLSKMVEVRLYLDNDVARVLLMTFPAGSASGWHSGPEHELGIVVEGELTLETAVGREVLGPGTVHWLPSQTRHDARNETDRPARLWVILFKRTAP